MRHFSLFLVCLHFFHCYRRCDKLPRSQYCFFLFSHKTERFWQNILLLWYYYWWARFWSGFMRYTNFYYWSWYLPWKANLSFWFEFRFNPQCDYYQEVYKPGEFLVFFTSVVARLYISYVLSSLLELDLTLRDERILVEEVYAFASDLMYEFLNSTNYLFFHEFFKLCCLEDWILLVVMAF